jgi:hypothetical protein
MFDKNLGGELRFLKIPSGPDSQTKFEFQTEMFLNILKIRFGGEKSERFEQISWSMELCGEGTHMV